MLRKVLIGIGALFALLVVLVVGGYLALLRPDIPYETLEARYGASDSRYVEIGEVRAHYRDDGAGAVGTILLIHGYGASAATWDAWTEALKPRFRLVRLDLPGHGLTRAPDTFDMSPDALADFADAFAGKLGLGPVIVVGHSMGGNVAWRLAERRPERVAALVLVGAAGFKDGGEGDTLLFRILASPFWAGVFQNLDSTRLAEQTLKASFVNQALVTPDMVKRYVELSRAPGHRTLLRALSLAAWNAEPATPERLARIVAPTLVIHGDKDALVPVENGRRFAAEIPGAQIKIYPDIGHIPQEEASEASAKDLAAFLAMLPPFSPLGQPLTLGVDPNAPGSPLPNAAASPAAGPPLQGVY